jgi:hypothetical protein
VSGTVKGRSRNLDRESRRHPRSAAFRWFVAGIVVGVVTSTVLAASIGFSGDTTLGAGSIAVVQCDADVSVEVGSAYDVTASTFTVSAITLGEIDTACAGKTLRLIGFSGSVTALDTTTTLGPTTSWASTITVVPASSINIDQIQGTALEIRD